MRKSAGILLYRKQNNAIEIFLVHPGGPFWVAKDIGAWSVTKGEFTDEEQPLTAAIREFKEETGALLSGDFIELTPVKQKGGKIVYAWALEGNIDADTITCNTFKMQWPPKSGQWKSFPEVDKAAWFGIEEAKQKINPSQVAFINELLLLLSKNGTD